MCHANMFIDNSTSEICCNSEQCLLRITEDTWTRKRHVDTFRWQNFTFIRARFVVCVWLTGSSCNIVVDVVDIVHIYGLSVGRGCAQWTHNAIFVIAGNTRRLCHIRDGWLPSIPIRYQFLLRRILLNANYIAHNFVTIHSCVAKSNQRIPHSTSKCNVNVLDFAGIITALWKLSHRNQFIELFLVSHSFIWRV